MMEDEVTLTREQVERVFAHWNKEAEEGDWPYEYNAPTQADHFMELARDPSVIGDA